MPNVFVYGTLKKGCKNHRLMAEVSAHYLGDAATKGTLFNLGPYPGLNLAGSTDVKGEVYKVPDEALEVMDRFEGVPFLYIREKIPTPYGEAFVYTYARQTNSKQVIKEGVWTE